MSIKDEYINKILNKEKNQKFITKRSNNDIRYIIHYVLNPVKKLKYILEVSNLITKQNKILMEGYENDKFNMGEEKYAYLIKEYIKSINFWI